MKPMRLHHMLLSLFVVAVMSTTALCQIPRTRSVQGLLTTSSNTPVSGSHSVKFSIYDDSTSAVSAWSETRSLDFSNGIYNAILGNVNALNISFDKKYYLGIAIDGAPELLPRTELASAPYALHAARADAITTGGTLDLSGTEVTGL